MDTPTATVVTTAIITAKPYLDLILKGPAKEIGEMFAETAGSWRTKNRLKIIKDTFAKFKQRKVKPAKILPDVLVPLLEAAGDTSDPLLSDMFSNLLVNHLDPKTQNLTHPSFTKVVGQLGPVDAKILKHVDEAYRKSKRFFPTDITTERIAEQLGIPVSDFMLNLTNLTRLGILEYGSYGVDSHFAFWRLTKYGEHLMQACSKKGHWLGDKTAAREKERRERIRFFERLKEE